MTARVSPRFVASVTWGTDSLLALAVTSPVVATVRSEFPHLGASAFVEPGGRELGEFVREQGHSIAAATLVFAVLLVFRTALALGVDAWHAARLGSTLSTGALLRRMALTRLLGLAACSVCVGAAFAPAYALRDVPIARFTTAGNLTFACAMALPSLAAAAFVACGERLARGLVAVSERPLTGAWGSALHAVLSGRSRARTLAIAVVLGTPILGAIATALARLPYGAGIVLGQLVAFGAAWLRAAAFAESVEARD